jgi:hypothetical protein
MKGTLSSTRIRPQIYSTREAGGPAFPPGVSLGNYGTSSFRDSRPNSTLYFRFCRCSVTAAACGTFKMTPALAQSGHVDERKRLC